MQNETIQLEFLGKFQVLFQRQNKEPQQILRITKCKCVQQTLKLPLLFAFPTRRGIVFNSQFSKFLSYFEQLQV
jgi:hypothetical protein